MTVYCYDTEFIENGSTIDLISIGIVCEDGREYYAVNSDMPVDRIREHDWLMKNVWPSLPLRGRRQAHSGSKSDGVLDTSSVLVKPLWVIRNEVREFLLSAGPPELWADYGAYDHVVLCQMWGPMVRLPAGLPMFTHDIEQLIETTEFQKPAQEVGEHNALEDARHNLRILTDYHDWKAGLL